MALKMWMWEKLFRIFCWTDLWAQRKFVWPSVLLIASISYEVMSAQIMIILSNIYTAISSGDVSLFQHTVWFGLFITTIVAILKSVIGLASDMCSLHWRKYVVQHIQQYLRSSYLLNESQQALYPINQRITQDVDRLTISVAGLVANILILPCVILYYTIYLFSMFGLIVPLICYIYFAFGSILSYFLAQTISDLVYQQEQFEGIFRNLCMEFETHAKEIHILEGDLNEKHRINCSFFRVMQNKYDLNWQKFKVNTFASWFAYTGSIGKTLCSNFDIVEC